MNQNIFMWNDIKPKHMDKHKPIVLEMNLKVVDIKFIDIQQIVMEKLKMNIAMFNNMPRNMMNKNIKPNPIDTKKAMNQRIMFYMKVVMKIEKIDMNTQKAIEPMDNNTKPNVEPKAKDKQTQKNNEHKASTIVKYSPLLRNIRFAPFSKYNVSG